MSSVLLSISCSKCARFDFRRKLTTRQFEQQREQIEVLSGICCRCKNELRCLVGNDLKYDAIVMFLDGILESKNTQLKITHSNKLARLYRGTIFLKEQPKSVINLSGVQIDATMTHVFNLGMNCHLRSKYDTLRKKIEVEKLYSQIEGERKKGSVVVDDDEMLRCELKRFGLRKYKNYDKDIITREQYSEIKALRADDRIVIRRADKSNTFVVLDNDYYRKQLDDVVADPAKFKRLVKDPTEKLKRKLNELIETVNAVQQPHHFKKLIGHFSPGYLYGNAKIHKSLNEPPLRPIISQIGTPTYETAKILNNILKKYIPSGYMVESTDEFLNMLQTANNRGGLLASLDVESLFTNVPVNETIDIILQHAYNDPE